MNAPKNHEELTKLAVGVLGGDYQENMTDEANEATRNLTLHDRCDQCGAQAYVLAVFSSGEIAFCGHHGSRHLAELEKQGGEIHDFRERLHAEATGAPGAST
jgi:ribosomal protein L37E